MSPRPYKLKAPLVVEAIQLTPETVKRAAEWTGGVEVMEYDANDHTQKFVALNIPTSRPETPVVRVQHGDWVVKDPAGRFSKVSDEEFQQYLIPVEGNNG
jgi:hypothetical protein